MQSHTCTASGSLSFRCDSARLEAVRSRSLSCLVHRRLLPSSIGLGYYMPTSFRLVRPQTTPYWERSALIPLVTSQHLLLGLSTDPTNQHEFFQRVLSSLARLLGNFSVGRPSKNYFKSSTLNYE